MNNSGLSTKAKRADVRFIGNICVGITLTIIAVTALGLLLIGPRNMTMTQFVVVVSVTSIPVMVGMLTVYLRARRKMIDA